jgi:hypothetical protein
VRLQIQPKLDIDKDRRNGALPEKPAADSGSDQEQ